MKPKTRVVDVIGRKGTTLTYVDEQGFVHVQFDDQPRPQRMHVLEVRPVPTYWRFIAAKPWTWKFVALLCALVGALVVWNGIADTNIPGGWRVFMVVLGLVVMYAMWFGARMNYTKQWR